MPLAVLVLTVAQLLDLGTFVRMIAVDGPATEANPLVLGLLVGHGLAFLAIAKIAALSFVVAASVVLAGTLERPRHPRLAGIVVAAAIAAGLIGGWSNASVIVGGIV